MADAVQVVIGAKDSASTAIQGVSQHLKTLDGDGTKASTALGKLGSAAGSAVTDLAKLGVVTGGAVLTGLIAVTNKAANFETAMSGVKASTGASAIEMVKLSRAAIDLGADTELAGIGASDAAKAMEELGKGGVTVEQQLGGATKGALLLASAGVIDVGEAATIATQAMNVFGLAGSDVVTVADLLTAGANKSATDVRSLGQAFQASAAVAKGANVDIGTLTGTLAFFAQRGLDGADAGTSLKTALLRLQAPTAEAAKLMDDLGLKTRDANGDMLSMPQLADNIQGALKNLTPAQRDAALATIFGNDAIRIGLGLYEGGGTAIRTWTANVNDAGIAARTGATRNDNLKGSLAQLGSTVETGAIAFGTKLTPVVRTATEELTKFLQKGLDSPQVQRAIEDLATKGSEALKNFFRTVQDPTFQQKAKEWLNAAVDVGKAIVSLAGDVKETLGPPLQAAARWFGDLDETGKKNVIMFGLVAGAAGKYHTELTLLKTVVEDVIGAFIRKEAAKKALTVANNTLAGSAGQTATAMTGTGTAAAGAAVAIADVAVVAGASVVVAAGVATGFGALATAMDTTNQRAKDFKIAQEAANLALLNGATPQNDAVAGYMRLVLALGPAVTGQGDLVRIWNQYVQSLPPGTTAVEGLRLAFAGTVQPTQDAALGLRGVTDGLGNITTAAGPLTTKLGAAITAMSNTMTTALTLADPGLRGVTDGLGNVAGAAGAATSTLNSQFRPALTGSGLAAGAFATAVAGAQGAVNNYDKALQTLGTEHGHLQTYLTTLQQEWDDLDQAVKTQGFTTDAQRQRYELLAPAIQFLNAKLGENKVAAVDATIAAVAQQQATENATTAAALGAISQGGYRVGLELATIAAQGHKLSTDDTTTAMNVARQAADDLTTAFKKIPASVSTDVKTPGLSDADTGVRNYTGALNNIPSSVTTTITTVYQTIGSPASTSGGSLANLEIGGFRADGGPVSANVPYVVGERGPELFVPYTSGAILPSGSRGGGGGGGPTIVINVAGSVISEGQLVDRLQSALVRKLRSNLTTGIA